MNNVIDEVLDLSSTGGAIKYTIAPDGQDSFLAQIDLATDVTTEGTPLNKVLFDSIRDDLNSRVSKTEDLASQNQAEQGIINTKWMSPLRTKQAITAQRKTRTYEIPLTKGQWNTITFANYINSNTQRLTLIASIRPSYVSYLTNSVSITTEIGTRTSRNFFNIDIAILKEEGATANYYNYNKIEVSTFSNSTTATPTFQTIEDIFVSLSLYPRNEPNDHPFIKLIAYDS